MLRGPPARALIITEIMEWAVRGGEMLDGPGSSPPRLATKTATQRPCPELHDHKIILVLSATPLGSPCPLVLPRHRALVHLSLSLSLSCLLHPRTRNERRERARRNNDYQPAVRSESKARKSTTTSYKRLGQMMVGVIDRLDSLRLPLMLFLRVAEK